MAKVVIALPAYRSAQTIAKTIAGVPEGFEAEMIVVDDHSPDNTAELARDLGLQVYVHPANLGYGANLKTCYAKGLEDGAHVIVVLHPDNQYEPKAVPALVAPILAGDADMTFGSRFAGLGDPRAGGMPIYRFLGNRIATIAQNFLLGSRFSEMHSGMRAYTRECLLSLPFLGYSDDFVFESQILVDAVTRGQRIVEVPVPTRFDEDSSSLVISRLFRYVWDSLTYTAKRTAQWGRKGRRWPAPGPRGSAASQRTSKRKPELRLEGPAPSSAGGNVDARSLDFVLERLGAYLLPGNTIAFAEGSEDLARRLTTIAGWQPASDPDPRAAAIIGRADGSALPTWVGSASAGLHPEGMLVLLLPTDQASGMHRFRGPPGPPSGLVETLHTHGFRLVDWDHVGHRSHRCTYGFARPVAE